MSVNTLRRILNARQGPAIERGRVVSVDESGILVKLRKSTKRVQNGTSFSVKAGDYVSLQGSQIIALRKPPPKSAIFQV